MMNEKNPPPPVSRKTGEPKVIAVLKLQTVETIRVHESRDGVTLGQSIDDLLERSARSGLIPNRLSIDLNPKSANPADVDSF